MEYNSGVERDVVIREFRVYCEKALRDGTLLPAEASLDRDESGPGDEPGPVDSGTTAASMLRRLIRTGWMSEEEQADFTRLISIAEPARPFFEAIHTVSSGLSVEYESHIIAVYSLLTSDAVRQDGEHAVMNAHFHTRLLIESLKTLEQNIRVHIEALYRDAVEIQDILHAHYDRYMHEVVDRAYNRLKTSDNLSRYRPRIIASVNQLLTDPAWLARTAEKYAVIKRIPVKEAGQRVIELLSEVRDDLLHIDPILERIDDRNRRYSRISTERIRTKLYSDYSLQGKIGRILKAWLNPDLPPELCGLGHGIVRKRFLDRDSLYVRRSKDRETEDEPKPEDIGAEIERLETELRLRLANQLNPARIGMFLAAYCTKPGVPVSAERFVTDVTGYVKILYAAVYAEGRGEEFPYEVLWEEGSTRAGRFTFQRHSFVLKSPDSGGRGRETHA